MAKKKPGSKKKAAKPRCPRPAPPPQTPDELASLDVETTSAAAKRPGCPVVGIGASAGGLDAFKRFFAHMPADCGLAFVLIPHLDPKQKSLMVELIARKTTMPVVEAQQDLRVEANHIYVIPPNKYLGMAEGRLRLSDPPEQYMQQPS